MQQVFDPSPVYFPSGKISLSDPIFFVGEVWIKNTSSLVMNYDGTTFPSILSQSLINITGSLSVNATAHPPGLDPKTNKISVVVIGSSKNISGTFLKLSAATNYTIGKDKCDKITFKHEYSDLFLHMNMTYETTSCNENLSDGAVIGIMIAIIVGVVAGVVGSHFYDKRKK